MEKRVDLEKRGRPVEEIVELNLDNCRATQIAGLTDDFIKLESLSLINVGLTTLKGFPALQSLNKLELSDNRISTGLNFLHGCPKLSYINLSGNKIKDITSLEPLKALSELRSLDLFNCEVCNLEPYREAVFELIEGLKFLDGFDRNNEEAEEDDDDDDLENEGDSSEGEEGSDDDGVVDVQDHGDEDHDDDDDDSDDEGSDDDDSDDDSDDIVVGGLGTDGDSNLLNDSVGGILDDDEDGEISEDDDDEDVEDGDIDPATAHQGTKRKLEEGDGDDEDD